jgi:amino-acid N-acetyltransferase
MSEAMMEAVISRPRRALPGDLDPARALLAAAGLPVAGVDQHFDRFWAIDTTDGRLAGIAGAEQYGTTWLVRSLVVDPPHRSRGVGSTLLAAVLDEARRQAAESVYLLTTDAQHFFAAVGFREVPRAAAPGALQASEELRGACPDTATLMRLEFTR